MSAGRGLARRAEVLEKATELFRTNGFDGVTIDEIGAAVGITGPALYRHFASKEEILTTILDQAADRLGAETAAAKASNETPRDALRDIIRSYLDLVIPNRRIAASYLHSTVWSADSEPSTDLRRRKRRQIDSVARILRAARPELSLGQARTLVHATFGVLNSVVWSGLVVDRSARDILEAAAMATLFSDPGAERAKTTRPAVRARRSA